MSYQLELRHIRYFLAVAEDLHFRKAAERLYISQPGLSRQIKEMEDNLGIRLFERTNRKVSLTKAGDYLKKELRDYFNGLELVLEHAKSLSEGLLGELKLGYVGSAMQGIIPKLLIAFREGHRKISFNLKEMDNQEQIDRLLDNDIDVGFVRLDRVPRGLKMHPVLDEPFCLALPTKHPINSSNFKNMLQLKEDPFILFDPKYSPSYYEKVMQIFDDSGYTPIVTHNTIHSSSIYKLIEHDFGISIVPKSLASNALKEVKFIELSTIPQRTMLSAVWKETNKNPVMTDFLKEVKKSKIS